MGKRVLKEFIQCLQNRLSITVAFAVIKLKPENFTGEEYAEKIQVLVLDHWFKNSNTSVFENKIIELQWDTLFMEINALFAPTGKDDDKLNDSFPGVCSEEFLSNEILNNSDTDSGDNEIFSNNISFVQAMIQLKFSVESSKSVRRDTFYNFWNTVSRNEKGHDSIIGKISRYSGFGEQNSQTVVDSMTSSIFRFITHSSKTEHLIKKCMTSVMQFAHKSVLSNTIETFNFWQGSVMEYLCSILQEVLFHPVCSDYILKFILQILDEIWSSCDINKHFIWEYQLYILFEFCVNSHVCERVIDCVIAKFNSLADVITAIQIGRPEHLSSIDLLEKLPHFTQFVTAVIRKFYVYKVADIQHNKKDIRISTYKNVKDLWKLKRRVLNENESECTKKNCEELVIKWKDICEKLITLSATNFPGISCYFWDILSTLQGCIIEISC